MSDIVERARRALALIQANPSVVERQFVESAIANAADEIERLRAVLKEVPAARRVYESKIEQLASDNERMRAALRDGIAAYDAGTAWPSIQVAREALGE